MEAEARFREVIAKIFEMPIIKDGLDFLDKSLPPDLLYHNIDHTRDVIYEAVRFAVLDGLDQESVKLLAVAAVFHDAGFTVRRMENEAEGARIAAQFMILSGEFSSEEISAVERMILDTKVQLTSEGPRQVSSSPLSGYLLDADLSNLGRDDFLQKWELLRIEGKEDPETFLKNAAALIELHKWHTPAAEKLRNRGKMENKVLVANLVAKGSVEAQN